MREFDEQLLTEMPNIIIFMIFLIMMLAIPWYLYQQYLIAEELKRWR